MHSEFEQIIYGLCALTGDIAPQRIIDGGGITIEEVTFTLMHKPAVDSGALFLYADFGQFDLAEQAALYPLILQTLFFFAEWRTMGLPTLWRRITRYWVWKENRR